MATERKSFWPEVGDVASKLQLAVDLTVMAPPQGEKAGVVGVIKEDFEMPDGVEGEGVIRVAAAAMGAGVIRPGLERLADGVGGGAGLCGGADGFAGVDDAVVVGVTDDLKIGVGG